MECDLSNDAKVFIASRPVIACDPKEAVINNKLGEDHVGVSILDGYSFRQLFIFYNESHIPIIDEEEEIGVRKKQYTFQKGKQNVGHSKHLVSIE